MTSRATGGADRRAAVAAAGGLCAAPRRAPCGLRQCDIRQPDCQRDNVRATACLRGQTPVDFPVTVKPQQAYIDEAEQEAAAVTEAERENFRTWQRGLALLGLGDPDVTLTQSAREQAAWVAAYYDPGTKAVTVIDGGQPAGFTVGRHRCWCTRRRTPCRTRPSAWTPSGAASPTTGSHAGVEVRHRGRGQRHRGSGGAGAVRRQRRTTSPGARCSTTGRPGPASRRSARRCRRTWPGDTFPYPYGTPYVQAAYQAQSLAGLDALYAQPPASAAQVLAGYGSDAARRWRLERGAGRSGGAAGAGAVRPTSTAIGWAPGCGWCSAIG